MDSIPYFTMGRPSPLKITPFHGGPGPHLIHDSFGQVHNQNGTISVSDRFSRFSRAHYSDRQKTDRPRFSICNNRMYVVLRCGLITVHVGEPWQSGYSTTWHVSSSGQKRSSSRYRGSPPTKQSVIQPYVFSCGCRNSWSCGVAYDAPRFIRDRQKNDTRLKLSLKQNTSHLFN